MEITNHLIIDSYCATNEPADPEKVVPYTNRISWCNPLWFQSLLNSERCGCPSTQCLAWENRKTWEMVHGGTLLAPSLS